MVKNFCLGFHYLGILMNLIYLNVHKNQNISATKIYIFELGSEYDAEDQVCKGRDNLKPAPNI